MLPGLQQKHHKEGILLVILQNSPKLEYKFILVIPRTGVIEEDDAVSFYAVVI